MENFPKIATPMNQFSRKMIKFKWNKECENDFQNLKQKLTTTPMLTTPISGELFMIYCDASTLA